MDNFGVPPTEPRLDQQQPMAVPPPVDAPMSPQMPPATVSNPLEMPPADPFANNTFEQPVMPQDTTPLATSNSGGGSEKMKTIIFGILGLLIVAGLTVGAYFLGLTSGKNDGYQQGKKDALADFQKEAAKENETKKETTQAKLELGELVTPDYKDETLEGDVGKQLQAADGLVLRVSNIERNFKPSDSNYQANPAKELVKVNFVIGNVEKSKAKDVNSTTAFRLENSTGAPLVPENIAAYEGKFDTVKLDPGTQMAQSIVYAVNKDEKPLKFVRSQTYRITNQNKEVTMKMIITVAK